MIVACVNVNNYAGRGTEYVRRLSTGVYGNLSVPHRFICVTDDPKGLPPEVETIPAHPGLSGNWQKMYLFAPGVLPAGERILYLDLDTVVLDDIDTLAKLPLEPFCMMRDFTNYPQPSSAIMSWRGGWGAHIWEAYERAHFPQPVDADCNRNDQATIARYCGCDPVRVQDHADGIYASWIHCRHRPPDDARLVVFWKRKKPHQVPWVRKMWGNDGDPGTVCD